jgi:class 3 adenylate cyclase
MSESESLFTALRQAAEADVVGAIERLVHEAPDRVLSRINALDFARAEKLDEEPVIAGFLHAARTGLFDLSWNILCPSCAGVLDANSSLKTVTRPEYRCAFCAAGYEPVLDEVVEVTFRVNPRLRRIAAHDPETLSLRDYYRQIFWSSGIDLPDDETLAKVMEGVMLEAIELPAGEKAILSLALPSGLIIAFDPVTHGAQFIEVKGEPTRERQSLSLPLDNRRLPTATTALRPGPLRLTLENRSAARALPGVWIADHELERLLSPRKPFLTAKRLLTNQTFRDIYRADTLDVEQRLKITSLTFLFTDLKGSTELYDRVGDLVAYDLVRRHFRVLTEIVGAEAGAVVKTIGDAVMATFPTPTRAVAAALRMREAMRGLNEERKRDDFLLKIGIHEGPCLAVMLNERQDYFGQTVNIASRVSISPPRARSTRRVRSWATRRRRSCSRRPASRRCSSVRRCAASPTASRSTRSRDSSGTAALVTRLPSYYALAPTDLEPRWLLPSPFVPSPVRTMARGCRSGMATTRSMAASARPRSPRRSPRGPGRVSSMPTSPSTPWSPRARAGSWASCITSFIAVPP